MPQFRPNKNYRVLYTDGNIHDNIEMDLEETGCEVVD
jgi:hypothetical protein